MGLPVTPETEEQRMSRPKWFDSGTIVQVLCYAAALAALIAVWFTDSAAIGRADIALGLLFVIVAAVFRIEELVRKKWTPPPPINIHVKGTLPDDALALSKAVAAQFKAR